MSDSDGSIRIKLDIDTSEEKEIGRSLENIQDDADNAKRKLDALKQTGVDENAKSFREAAAELEKYNKELDEYLRKQKEAANSNSVKPIKVSDTGSFESISDQVEDYETRLKMLRNKGYGPGDAHFDELYIAWKNAVNAEKEYLANLNKMTDKSIADEAKKQEEVARKLQEEAEEYERLNRIRAQAKVHDKDLVKLLEKQKAITARMAELKRAGVGEGYKEYDSLSRKLKGVNNSINECRNGFKKAGESGKKTLSSLNKSTKKSSSLFSAMASRLKGLALSLLIFNWISKGFNAMVSAMKEGFRNLASYSKEYNGVMSEFKSSLAELKNNLAAAFEPIVNTVVPYLTRMVDGLNTAIDTVSRFLAYMSGKSYYTRAKKQLIDYKEAVDSTNKSLAKFDDLNVLSQKDGSGGELTGADAFETVEIGEVPESFKQIKDVYDKYVLPTLENFQGVLSAVVDKGKLLFSGLWEAATTIWETIGAPIFDFIVDIVGDTVDFFSTDIGDMGEIFDTFVSDINDSWENYLKPALKSIGEFLDNILFPAFRDVFRGLILPIVRNVFKGIGNLWTHTLKPVFDGICEFLNGVFSGDLEMALDGIGKIFQGAINAIITFLETGINSAIDGMNYLISKWNSIAAKIDAPELDYFSNVNLPRLGAEDSGITFDNSKYNKTEVFYGNENIRYRRSEPQADWKNSNSLANTVRTGSSFNGKDSNNTYTFVAQLNGRTIFNEVVNQNELNKNRSGRNVLAE